MCWYCWEKDDYDQSWDLLKGRLHLNFGGIQRRIQGEGCGGCTPPPPWEVFEIVWLPLDDEVEVIMGEEHFISQIPWK